MNSRFYLGIFFFLSSYFPLLLPKELLEYRILTLFNLFFMLGVIYIAEGITFALKKKSLLNEIKKSAKNLIAFVAVSTAGAILLDGIAKWLGKLWIYPYFNIDSYLFFFIPGFALYWLMIVESYLAVKVVIDYLHKGREVVTRSFGFETALYKMLGIAGFLLLVFTSSRIVLDYYARSSVFFDVRDVAHATGNYQMPFRYIMMISLGLWFVLECIEYLRKKTSLLKDILHHYFSPISSILIGSLLLAVVMETQNIPAGYWVYINWPFEHTRLFGVSVVIYFAWILHYILFLSLFRAFTEKESDQIWGADTIE